MPKLLHRKRSPPDADPIKAEPATACVAVKQDEGM